MNKFIPKEKASFIVLKYMSKVVSMELAKECALIAVDEAKKCTKYEKQMFEDDRFSEDYWNLVEQEINKL